MDIITSRHGLAKLTSTSDANDTNPLSPELQTELESLEKIFTVDTAKLKEISKRFGEELQEGRSSGPSTSTALLTSSQGSIRMDQISYDGPTMSRSNTLANTHISL